MGQEILYCFKCQERITSGDLDSSNALRFGNRVSCKNCIPDLVITLTPQEQKELVARVQAPAADSRNRSGYTPRPRQVVPSPPKATKANPAAWVALAAVGVAVLIGVAAFAMSGSGPVDPRSKEVVVPPKHGPRPPEESPRERTAREALAKAKAVSSSNLDGQIAAFAVALKVTEGTPHYREAKEMHEGLLEMRRKAFVRELTAADERARITLQKEEFGTALAIYEALRSLHAESEWKSLVDAKVGDVRKAVDLAYGALKEQAVQARGKGAEDEVKKLRERLSRWGLAEKTADFDAHLETLAPPAPPPAVDARPWIPIFDGKSLDFLVSSGEGAWVVENGAIHHVKGKRGSAQTKRRFTNGEMRIRFAARNSDGISFSIRQGFDGVYSVFLDRAELAAVEGRDLEVLIAFRAAEVSATLDGKAKVVQAEKTPLQGSLQFNTRGGGDLIVKSIEYRDDPLYDGLVGWWTFDVLKDEVATDFSGTKNNGKVAGIPPPVPGRIGNAFQLDGRRSHVSVPASPSLDLTGPFAISVWVKPKAENRNRGLVEKWGGDPQQPKDLTTGYFLRLNQTGNVQFIIPAAGDPDPEVRTPDVVAPDIWSHVAAVFDGTSMKVYINGKLSKSVNSNAAPRSDGADLKIGMAGGGGSLHFPGEMDDVRLYNRALTPDEIARLAK